MQLLEALPHEAVVMIGLL